MKNQLRKFSSAGFTMIELVMVILVLAVVGVISFTNFIDIHEDARESAIEQVVQSIRAGVLFQHKSTFLKCANNSRAIIPYDSFIANDVTVGAAPLCTTTQIPVASDRKIYDASGAFNYVNQRNGLSTVGFAPTLADGETYLTDHCSPSSTVTSYGWCYTEEGDFFAADDESRTVASGGSSSASSAASSAPDCSTSYYTWNDVPMTCTHNFETLNVDHCDADSAPTAAADCLINDPCGDGNNNNYDDCNGDAVP